MAPEGNDCAPLFKAVGDETRFAIFTLLSQREVCACELLEHLHITQPTLSHHMKVLAGCGLVNSRKDGPWMRYTVNRASVAQMQAFLEARSAAVPAAQAGCRGEGC